MWQYNYSQPSDELMHYGKMGMKWGKRSGPKRTEADTARSLAKGYTNAMDKRSAKRPGSVSRKQEAKTAHKIADKYTTAMDKKSSKTVSKSTNHSKRNVALGVAALAAIATVSIVAAKSGTSFATGKDYVNSIDMARNLDFNISKLNGGPSNMAKNLAYNMARKP